VEQQKNIEAERKREREQNARRVEYARLPAGDERAPHLDQGIPERDFAASQMLGKKALLRQRERKQISIGGDVVEAEQVTERECRDRKNDDDPERGRASRIGVQTARLSSKYGGKVQKHEGMAAVAAPCPRVLADDTLLDLAARRIEAPLLRAASRV
jgi:hypothetical protein